MLSGVPPEHLSTLAYLWRQSDAQARQFAFRATSVDEWQRWRADLRARLAECLGGLPDERCPLSSQHLHAIDRPGYREEQVLFYSEPGVAVPCSVLIPRSVPPPYRPVIALHGHGGDGTRLILGHTCGDEEAAQLRGYNYDYARQLALHGFMVFAPVQRALGDRNEPDLAYRTGTGLQQKSCEMAARVGLLLGKTLVGLRVWDVIRTVDYVRSRPEPLAEGIGCLGFSGGGTVALYAAALDDRLSVAVVDGAFCTYRDSIMCSCHCLDNYLPGILRYADVGDIGGLIAPRPFLVEHGTEDNVFPIEGVRQACRDAARPYALLGQGDRFRSAFFRGGHRFGGREAFRWLGRWLGREPPTDS